MRRLNGVDALMLYTETPEIHMHTLKIGVLDVSGVEGGFSFDLFRSVAYPRLLAMAPLRHQLVDVPLKLRLTAMATTIAKENNQLLGPTNCRRGCPTFHRRLRRECFVGGPIEWSRPA